jgi:hypothetical protein
MAEKVALDKAWAEAARRCRLSPADVRMAKELGFKPRSLLKNQPSPQQPWKAPVAEWVRVMYPKRERRSEQRRQRRERVQEAMVTCQTRNVQGRLRQRRQTSDDSPAPLPYLP